LGIEHHAEFGENAGLYIDVRITSQNGTCLRKERNKRKSKIRRMMEIAGYAMVRSDAKIVTAGNPKDYINGRIRCMEINSDGDILALAPNGASIAMIDAKDVISSFRCDIIGDVVIPPGLSMIDKISYSAAAMGRKGGYNQTVREMVIAASLHSNKFNDGFIWSGPNSHHKPS